MQVFTHTPLGSVDVPSDFTEVIVAVQFGAVPSQDTVPKESEYGLCLFEPSTTLKLPFASINWIPEQP